MSRLVSWRPDLASVRGSSRFRMMFALCLGAAWILFASGSAFAAEYGSISGTVTDRFGIPLHDICVDAYGTDDDYQGSYYTGDDGAYTLVGLSTGSYRVKYSDCGSGQDVAYEFYNRKPTLATADTVEVTAGSDTPDIDAQLVSGGSISGKVTDSSGTPLAHICVGAYDLDDGNAGGASTDSSGIYMVRGLPAGSYRLRFLDCGSGQDVATEFYNDKSTLAAADAVTVTGGSDTPGINAALKPEETSSSPDTMIDAGPSGTISSDEATFEFSGVPAGDTAKVQCKLDDGAWMDCVSPKTFSSLSDGEHTVYFRAEDAAGDQDETPATRTFTVDTSPPGPSAACTAARSDLTVASRMFTNVKKQQRKAARMFKRARKPFRNAQNAFRNARKTGGARKLRRAQKRLRATKRNLIRSKKRTQLANRKMRKARQDVKGARAVVADTCT